MHVRLDESWQQPIAIRIHDPIVWTVGGGTERGNPSVSNRHVTDHRVEPIVHRQDGGVADQKGHGERIQPALTRD